MTILEWALLFLAAIGGGALNSVAGGGSFLTFPTLLFTGVSPIAANATSTVALWPGSIASTSAYREDIRSSKRYLLPFSVVSVIGGFIGARILLRTSQDDFRALVPWLLLLATLVFALGDRVVSTLRGRRHGDAPAPTTGSFLPALLTQLVIATYGGFFGGGMGILMLATFTILGLRDIHAMNGMKNWLAVCINGIAVITFVVAGAVLWPQALVMLGGAVLGGYGGASLARRIDPKLVRRFVIVLGLGLSGYFFLSS